MVGLTVGPLLAGVLEVHLSWRWFFAAVGLLALASGAGFIALFRGEREPEADRDVLAITVTVLREPAVILLSLAAAWYFFSMIGAFTYLATSLKEAHGLPEDRIGLVLALSGAVGIPASAIAGHSVDRWGRKAVAVAGLAGYVMALMGLIALPYSFGGVLVLSALLGWFGTVAWIALNTLAVEIMPALRKPVASIYNAVRFFGYSLAPPVLGLAYGDGNAALVYVIAALVACASAGLILAMRAPRPPHPPLSPGGEDDSRAGSL
jgi:predicted MFS family arabinose efflux permease